MKFSEKIIELRKVRGLSQEDLANKLDVTRQTISKWEQEQTVPDMNKLVEISKIFNISVDELINNENVTKDKYEETVLEKRNKKISVILFITGIIITTIFIILGYLKHVEADKINAKNYKAAYDLSVQNYNKGMQRVEEIGNELLKLDSEIKNIDKELEKIVVGQPGWSDKKFNLNSNKDHLISKYYSLENERYSLANGDYRVTYNLVDEFKYKIYYYIAIGVFVLVSLISLIYFLVTRKK